MLASQQNTTIPILPTFHLISNGGFLMRGHGTIYEIGGILDNVEACKHECNRGAHIIYDHSNKCYMNSL